MSTKRAFKRLAIVIVTALALSTGFSAAAHATGWQKTDDVSISQSAAPDTGWQ
ncbi:hypothetical protein [Wenjunlia tyrosinilytica]|uniref:Uncharacterized protein n=1 Tax=Wenjunlia tyrosinilytica TaxID=1544741 RepID=A0A918DT97_9ACTN|nr:hypothetical protein [Wenjunlia tyrosinilytica]GGO83007.1 hypothetical protein GCM10012280_10940 [Wenjunlia tyrosinilytica]